MYVSIFRRTFLAFSGSTGPAEKASTARAAASSSDFSFKMSKSVASIVTIGWIFSVVPSSTTWLTFGTAAFWYRNLMIQSYLGPSRSTTAVVSTKKCVAGKKTWKIDCNLFVKFELQFLSGLEDTTTMRQILIRNPL